MSSLFISSHSRSSIYTIFATNYRSFLSICFTASLKSTRGFSPPARNNLSDADLPLSMPVTLPSSVDSPLLSSTTPPTLSLSAQNLFFHKSFPLYTSFPPSGRSPPQTDSHIDIVFCSIMYSVLLYVISCISLFLNSWFRVVDQVGERRLLSARRQTAYRVVEVNELRRMNDAALEK